MIQENTLLSSIIFKNYQCFTELEVETGNGSQTPFKDIITAQRRLMFAQQAIMVVDIETLTLDNNAGLGNQFPYMICVYGTARSLN